MKVAVQTERVWRMVAGAHVVDAITNNASKSSDTEDRTPIARTARTDATISASFRSPSVRLPFTVTDRYRRHP